MKIQPPIFKYHEAALAYLQNYYHAFADENYYFDYPFIKRLVEVAEKVAESEGLTGSDFEKALLIVCFRFAGVFHIVDDNLIKYDLLQDFSSQIKYPPDDTESVKTSIKKNVNFSHPDSLIEKVAWDSISYRFSLDGLIVHVPFLMEELNRNSKQPYTQLEILSLFKGQIIKSTFNTDYAKIHYSEKVEKNLFKLNKKIQKLQSLKTPASKNLVGGNSNFSDKETEDLFKIAFRNYVHLVSVADSKAGLLINVNSIIISVVIAFVVSRSEKYPFLIIPSFVLLGISFLTILLSILASRPQGNHYIQDKQSGSYQTFFFGSFDLTGKEFSKAGWANYSEELDSLLKGGKEKIYQEMYKEAFNVRKVLGKKFSYLSVAYWTFLSGLLISIIIFFVSTYKI